MLRRWDPLIPRAWGMVTGTVKVRSLTGCRLPDGVGCLKADAKRREWPVQWPGAYGFAEHPYTAQRAPVLFDLGRTFIQATIQEAIP
jgi:hypothetical protein